MHGGRAPLLINTETVVSVVTDPDRDLRRLPPFHHLHPIRSFKSQQKQHHFESGFALATNMIIIIIIIIMSSTYNVQFYSIMYLIVGVVHVTIPHLSRLTRWDSEPVASSRNSKSRRPTYDEHREESFQHIQSFIQWLNGIVCPLIYSSSSSTKSTICTFAHQLL